MLQYCVLLTSIMHFLLVFKLQIALLRPLSPVTFSPWPSYSCCGLCCSQARQQCAFMFSLQHNNTQWNEDEAQTCSRRDASLLGFWNQWLAVIVVPQTRVVFAAKWRMMLIPAWTALLSSLLIWLTLLPIWQPGLRPGSVVLHILFLQSCCPPT